MRSSAPAFPLLRIAEVLAAAPPPLLVVRATAPARCDAENGQTILYTFAGSRAGTVRRRRSEGRADAARPPIRTASLLVGAGLRGLDAAVGLFASLASDRPDLGMTSLVS